MGNDQWLQQYEEFVAENEREPSDREMQNAWSSSYIDRYDRLRDEYKNKGKLSEFHAALKNAGKS